MPSAPQEHLLGPSYETQDSSEETQTSNASTNQDAMEQRRTQREARSDSSSSSEQDQPHHETVTVAFDDLKPDGKLSLTGISLESYVLGNILGAGTLLTIYFLFINPSRIWRTPAFLSILSLFHFGEFYTYARWNLKNTKSNSFLTMSNGRPYTYAMTVALLETTLTSVFFPAWQARWAHIPLQLLGVVLVVLGQYMRDSAIATAGVSFNHIVQRQKRSDHVLITSGPYAWCRHPSYFGFYWWAVGTQVLLGNVISTPLFALILWRFFFRRIPGEEKALIEMFGDQYIQFRAEKTIGIPLMGSAVDRVLIKHNVNLSRS
ncbi:ICMT-domain-containing protein [Microthyrium microscopicum]|uniref:Protein-S-isoprenylcysteine O-methyltransferase n=1 Tax=Microthyrium microscopicum TaxID=703497 RepID=A0A6A6UT90_9PEZI|nr:ICMT-domain-containing protein [Microthyrium microscopicum]